FAKVIEEGSFRSAARQLGLAPSRISETVSELEKHLGVTLLYRSTRKISLTNEGNLLYSHVADMLRSADAGLNELNAVSTEPAGTLRVSIPAFLVSGPLSTAIATFARQFPKVNFTVAYTDRRMRLVEDGFDVNIRVGWLEDSTMMARKLAEGQRWVVAGVEYAKAYDKPERPADMAKWDWIRFSQRSDKFEFTSESGLTELVATKSQIEVDSIDAVYQFCMDNMGASVLPSFLAERGINSGKLVRLLPEWKLSPLGIYAVWPDNSRRESLTLQFVRYLAQQGLC
ncbi:MAG: LysR family transcriptional regulator, partial [Pseudomonadota bacterium]